MQDYSKESYYIDMNHVKAVFLLMLTALLWSFAGVFIKYIDLGPMAVSGGRSACAAIVIAIYIKKPRFTWSLAQILGAVAYIVYVNSVVFATKMTTSANAVMLLYTAPIYAAVLGRWLLKEKVPLKDWITVFIVLLGMFLFFVDGISTRNMMGNIIAVISGISFACFAVLMCMQKNGSPLESVLLGNIATAIVGIPFLINSKPSVESGVALLVLGTMQFAVPYILFAWAVKHVTALESVLVPIIDPVLNPVWVFIVIGEIPGNWTFIGGVIILGAVLIKGLTAIRYNY